MKKLYLILLLFSFSLCSCNNNYEDEMLFSAKQVEMYSNAIAGMYEGNCTIYFTAADKKIHKTQCNTQLYISDNKNKCITFFHIPLNWMSETFSGDKELCNALVNSPTYDIPFNYNFSTVIQPDGVEFRYNCNPFYFVLEYGGKKHFVSINIECMGHYFPITTDMSKIKEDMLGEGLTFYIKSVEIDNKLYLQNCDYTIIFNFINECMDK